MQDAYITLEEAAAFEGILYDTFQKRVKRSPQQYDTKTQAREGGGKDQVLISVASLTTKAWKAWRATQKVDGRDVIIDRRATEAVPWYVTADLNHYIEGHKKAYYEAVEAARVVQEFIDYAGPEKRTDLAARLAVGLGVSPQSFYRYQTQVLEANAWALKLEREDGQCRDYFRALALCRKPKEADTFPSLTPEQRAIIENIWFDKQFASNLGTREIPNMMGTIMVAIAMQIPNAIFTEAFLSFIGLGVSAPMASWGTLCNDALASIYVYPYQLLIPAVAISVTILAFNLFSDGLRDAFDPKQRK